MRVRLALGLSIVIAALALGASPASAHTLTGVAPTNYRSEIIAINPTTPTLDVTLLDLGRRIRLTNHETAAVTVLGYLGEPYLRVGPDGAYENRNSPTTYRNRTPSETPPENLGANVPADWRRIATDPTATWADQRTRWEGPDPPEVVSAPSQPHVVNHWQIQLQGLSGPINLNGQITWIPGPSPVPWYALTALLAVAVTAIAAHRAWPTLLAATLAALLAIDAINAIGSIATSTNSVVTIGAKTLSRDPLTTFAWIAAGIAVTVLHQRDKTALVLAGLASWTIATTSALTDAAVFDSSQLPTRLAPALARTYVALTLGLGAGTALAAIIVAIRLGWIPWRALIRRR